MSKEQFLNNIKCQVVLVQKVFADADKLWYFTLLLINEIAFQDKKYIPSSCSYISNVTLHGFILASFLFSLVEIKCKSSKVKSNQELCSLNLAHFPLEAIRLAIYHEELLLGII